MKILRGVLGLVVGGFVNMSLILISPQAIPPPAGVNVNDVESIRASMHLYEPKYFVFPFLAHALGTFVGALVAYLIATRAKRVFANVIGLVTLAGGIAAASIIPAPAWFIALDLVLAYLPMALLATIAGQRLQSST